MLRWIAVGVPSWPRVGSSWSWWPLLTVPGAFLLARVVVGVRLRPAAVATIAIGGTVWAYAISAWGVPLAGVGPVAATFVVAALWRRPQPR